jgi:hypothetical protein
MELVGGEGDMVAGIIDFREDEDDDSKKRSSKAAGCSMEGLTC